MWKMLLPCGKPGRTLDAWLREHGVSEEEIVAEFDQLRKAGRKHG
jgi:hypothetical protein